MRNVLVTGGSGKLGKFVSRHLSEAGWSVTSVDRVPHPDLTVSNTVVDLLDSGSVMDLMTGANERHDKLDAVVY